MYNDFNLEFCRNLNLFTKAIDLNFFLNEIKVKKKI